MSIPGFCRGRRYVAILGSPKYFNFYETETAAVLSSAAYLERLDSPTDWTRRVVRHFEDTSRTVCSVARSIGVGDGVFVATLRLASSEDSQALSTWIGALIMERLLDRPGIVAVHLLEGLPETSGAQTAEEALRDQPDKSAAWILLVEAVDAELLQAAISGAASQRALAVVGASYVDDDYGIYRLQYSLSRDQVVP